MKNVLPRSILAVIDDSDPLFDRYKKFARKRNLQPGYNWCDFCGYPLEESGMRVGGKLAVSAKTCRNPLCPMCDDTMNPDRHREECAKFKGKRNG